MLLFVQRPDLDFDTVLRTLMDRSAALIPVEPRFHPDVAPFLSRLPDEVAISERQRKIAELNAFRPPVPDEWLPVAHPSDVENPERILESYGDLSEGLMAALHTKVPSLMDETAESLTDLDFFFWREDFPEKYERHLIDGHTAPALGAYLGDVLVRRLGGKWVLACSGASRAPIPGQGEQRFRSKVSSRSGDAEQAFR